MSGLETPEAVSGGGSSLETPNMGHTQKDDPERRKSYPGKAGGKGPASWSPGRGPASLVNLRRVSWKHPPPRPAEGELQGPARLHKGF